MMTHKLVFTVEVFDEIADADALRRQLHWHLSDKLEKLEIAANVLSCAEKLPAREPSQ